MDAIEYTPPLEHEVERIAYYLEKNRLQRNEIDRKGPRNEHPGDGETDE